MRLSKIKSPAQQWIFSTSLSGEEPDCPSLRASNEHILIVRVLRARRIVWLLPSCSSETVCYLPSRGGLAWSPTAHVERPLLHRGGSVSTGDQPGHPSSLLSRYRPLRHTAHLWKRIPHLPVSLSPNGTKLCWKLRRRSPSTEICTHFFEILPSGFPEWRMSILLP